jgi:hypothetical protein
MGLPGNRSVLADIVGPVYAIELSGPGRCACLAAEVHLIRYVIAFLN